MWNKWVSKCIFQSEMPVKAEKFHEIFFRDKETGHNIRPEAKNVMTGE